MLFVSKGLRQMPRSRLVAFFCVIALVVVTVPASAHDVYRFVGPIVKWDEVKRRSIPVRVRSRK